MEQTESIVLYELDGCPFCAKVIDKMNELGLDYDSVMVEGERPQVKKVTGGPTGVPVIEDPNTDEFEWMNESDDIVEYLERVYG